MKILKISGSNWDCELELTNFIETDEYDLGYEFETLMQISCDGFKAKTKSFYFTKKELSDFYSNIKRLSQDQIDKVMFESTPNEFKLEFLKKNNDLLVSVNYQELESDDSLSSKSKVDYPTLNNILSDIDSFFLAF